MADISNRLVVTIEVRDGPQAEAQLAKLKKSFDTAGLSITKITETAKGGYKVTAQLTDSLAKQQKTTDQLTTSTYKAGRAQGNYFAHIAKTTVQSLLVNKAFLVFIEAAGQAVKQADLLVNFPATMKALGVSTDVSREAFQKLRVYTQSVGGDLSKAANSVTRFVGVNKNLKVSTALYQGISNALIVGNASAEIQAGALEQLTQAYSRGQPQLIEWRSLLVAMQEPITQVARKLGFINAQALGDELTNGRYPLEKFLVALTELSTGSGPIANQVQLRLQGIEFAANLLRNTLVNGLTDIYNTIGRSNIVAAFGVITVAIQRAAVWAKIFINFIITIINLLLRLTGNAPLAKLTGDTEGVAQNLDTGAGAAKDLGGNLDDASKSAKKLNGQLAAFDKMNVLQEKSADGGGAAGGKAGGRVAGIGFDVGQVAQLEDIFNKMNTSAAKATGTIKVLGDILAGISIVALLTKLFTGKSIFIWIGKAIGAIFTAIATALGIGVGWLVLAVVAIIAAIYIIWRNWDTIVGWIKKAGESIINFYKERWTVFITFWTGVWNTLYNAANTIFNNLKLVFTTIFDFFKSIAVSFINNVNTIWNTLYDIFSGPIKFFLEFARGIFIAFVAVVAIILETVFKLFVGAFNLIFNFLSTVAQWIYDNVTLPILNFFISLWNGIINVIIGAWNFIYNNILKPVALWIYNNVILPVFNFFRDLWNNVINFIVNFFNRAKDVLGGLWLWIKVNVVDRIANIFAGLWQGIKDGLVNAFEGIKFILTGAANIFKTPLNAIIELINKVIRQVNRLTVPPWVPGLGGSKPNLPELAKLAKGGVVTTATTAIIGENGAEAVVPLENNTDWIDMLAAKINSVSGSSNQPINLVVQIGEDKVASKIIDLINEKTQMSGRNTILV